MSGKPAGPPRVRVESDGAIGRLVLDRAEKKNALDRRTLTELADGIDRLGEDAAVRVVALESSGDDFCAGADLEALGAMLDAGVKEQRRDAEALARVLRGLRQLEKPAVAVVRGRALAGGCGLATACDLVIASESATFGYPEVKVGFVPAMVMVVLRRLVGERWAADLVFSGRLIEAREAWDLGLITHVVGDDDLDEEADKLLNELAALPGGAVGRTKRLLYELDGMSFDEGLALAAEQNVKARLTAEFRDGVRRFLGRRKGS